MDYLNRVVACPFLIKVFNLLNLSPHWWLVTHCSVVFETLSRSYKNYHSIVEYCSER